MTLKKFDISISAPALQDLREIGHYIDSQYNNHNLTEQIINEIMQMVFSLDMFPERFVQIIVRGKRFRKAIVKHYAIIYSVIKEFKLVSIERVLYSARDINKIKIG